MIGQVLVICDWQGGGRPLGEAARRQVIGQVVVICDWPGGGQSRAPTAFLSISI